MANCAKCGLYNEYQDGPYVCRGCTGGAAEGATVIHGTPAERLGAVAAAYEAGMLPDLSLAGGKPRAQELSEVDAEIINLVVERYKEAFYDRKSPIFTLIRKRDELLTNPADLAAAEAALEASRAAQIAAKEAINKLPHTVRGQFFERFYAE